MRIPFIAIGTGRCGTVSLSRIIGACDNVLCTHESYVTNWYEPKMSKLNKLLEFLEKSYCGNELRGEVQPHILPHLPFFKKRLPHLKIICLHRPCEEVVASFLRRGIDKLRPSARPYQKNTKWVYRLPDIEAHSHADAVRCYWEMYEKYMAEMEGAFHLQTRELNDDGKIAGLFDFLEIPEEDRVFIEDRVFNAASEKKQKNSAARRQERPS